MRLARLPLATLALVALAACSNDATGPETPLAVTPAGPQLNGGYFGSGTRDATDSLSVSLTVVVLSSQQSGTTSSDPN